MTQTQDFGKSVKSAINHYSAKASNLIPGKNDYALLIQVAIRAVVVSTTWVTGIFVAILSASKIADFNLNVTLGFASATSIFGNSLGSVAHVDASQWSAGTFYPHFYSGTVRPTMISLLILWTLCRSALSLTPLDASRKLRGAAAAAVGIATSLFIAISSALSAGSISNVDESWTPVSLTSATLRDFITVLLVSSLTIGVYLNQSKRAKSKFGIVTQTHGTTIQWALFSLRLFTKFFTLLAIAAIIIFTIVNLIRPDFLTSSPASTSSTPVNSWALVLPVVGILIYLPTLYFFAIAYACGIVIGFETQGSSVFSEAISAFLNTHLAITSGQSIFDTSMSSLGIVLIVLAAFTAITVGAWSARIVRPVAKWDHIWIQGLITSTTVLVILNWFTSAKGTWTNNGVQAQHAVSGQIIADSGFVRYGLFLGSLTAFAIALATLTAVSATRLNRTVNLGLPRLSYRMTRISDVEYLGTPKAQHRAFGRLVAVAAALALLIPIGASAFERNYATENNVTQIALKQIQAIESGDPKLISEEFGLPGDAGLWLPSKALKQATRDDNGNLLTSSIEILNLNNEAWKLGQLDAVTKFSWTRDNKISSWTVNMPGETQTMFRWLKKAAYRVSASPLNITVKGGDFYPKNLVDQIKVNGVKVKPGSYFGVPGFYHVTAPASGLIAATDLVFYAVDGDLEIVAGDQLSLPKATESQVKKTTDSDLNACMQITKKLTSKCLPGDEIIVASQQTSQTEIGLYDQETYSKIKASKPVCTEAKQKFTSVTSIQFESKCSQTITFTANYITNAVTEPITETVTTQTYVEDGYEDGDCIDYDFEFDYCNEYEQVSFGHYESEITEKVIGQKIITPASTVSVEFSSDVSFTYKLIVAQQKDKTFIVCSPMSQHQHHQEGLGS